MGRFIAERQACPSEAAAGDSRTAIICPQTDSVPPRDPLVPTIFHETWWLEAATRGNYGVAEVSQNGKVVGRLPYAITRRAGMNCNLPPTLTHFLGPAISELKGNPNTRFLRRLKITDELIQKLPGASLHKIRCHRGVEDIVAFQTSRFDSSVQFTCEIHPGDPQLIWKNMRDKTRNVIRRAQEKFRVIQLDDAREFMRFYEASLEGKNTYDSEICHNLIAASLIRRRGKIFAAITTSGHLAAAIFCVWDHTSSFYLMSTRGRDSGNGAVSLLLWEAIQHAMQLNLIFDFDGLYSNGSILFYSGFGPIIQPRYLVSKASQSARLTLEMRGWFRERTYLW